MRGRWWCDLIETTTAQTVATYADGRYRGRPAITRNRYGDGSILYLGTYLDTLGYQDVLTQVVQQAGLAAPWRLPPGCEVTCQGGITFLFNHTSEERIVRVPSAMVEVHGTAVPAGAVTMPPQHVQLLRDAE